MKRIRYDDIAQDLTRDIVSGRYEVGAVLPTELELCERYGTSRHTVRAALQQLQDSGLVSRRKNVGTRVESKVPTQVFTQSLVSIDDLVHYGATHLRQVCSIGETIADKALARLIDCEVGARWLHIGIMRMAEGRWPKPLVWADVYVVAEYAEIAGEVRSQPHVLTSTLLEERYGRQIARIQQDVQAVSLSDGLADVLKAEPGSPALRIVRRYLDARDVAFEVSVSVHPADRFTLSSVLQRARA